VGRIDLSERVASRLKPEDRPAPPGFLRSLVAFVTDFLRYAGRQAVVAAALVGVGAVLDGLGVLMLIPILGVVVASSHAGGRFQRIADGVFQVAGAETPLARLLLLLGVYAVLMIVRAVMVTWRDVKLAELQVGFQEAQRASVTELLAAARWDQLARLRHSRITHLMSGDVQRVSTGVNFLLSSIVSIVMLVAQCVVLLVLSPALAAIAFGLLAVIGLALGPMVRHSQTLGRYVTEANLALLNSATQFLGGLKLAISQNLQTSFTNEFRDTLNALTRRQIEGIRQRTYTRLAINLLSAAVGGAIVLIGFGFLHVPTTVLITALLVISRMGGPVSQIQQGLQQVAAALPAYETVVELKRELAAVAEARPDVGSAPFPDGPVVFEDVAFHHPGASDDERSERGVDGLDMTLRPGAFLGVAGPSGAGKTTFADLLVGLVPPQRGQITVGGRPLQGATLTAWRQGVSYVSQDPFLFHDTVRRNLVWARADATEADMWRALELAQADDIVRRMDHGLDTLVGERGTLVSGGERQRIALARAVLRRPRLLLLDEATNAIDVAAERTLLERLCALNPRPTIVMIAHRPESLALCRTVLRLEAGAFVDDHETSRPATAIGAS
jgi:ATP-binding cassette subfamily C protein